MKAYREIFLSKELNKALNDVLVCVHHHFREDKDINEEILREIYKPILECPVLKDDMVWLNAWRRRHVDKPEIYFIKETPELSKKIMEVWRHHGKEYDQYVNSLSVLAKSYGLKQNRGGKETLLFPIDYSFLITIKNHPECDLEMASEYVRDFFVYLKFERVVKIFENLDFNNYREEIDESFKNGTNDGNKKIIQILQESYKHIKEACGINDIINNLSSQLGSAWKSLLGDDINTLISRGELLEPDGHVLTEDDHKANIIKLINYYFWIELAYHKDWDVLLYLPGVMAKKFESVPLGVNIGLKKMPPLEIILFLKKVILLFFTRASIDYFEEVTKGTIISHGRRTAATAIMARNMSHNIGSHVLANISMNEIITRPKDMIILTSFLQQRMDFVASITARQKHEWTEPIFFYSDLLQGFLNQGLLLDYLVRDDGYCASDKTYGAIQFCVKKDSIETGWTFHEVSEVAQKKGEFSRFIHDDKKGYNDFLVAIPGGAVGKQAFYGFLENAMRNAAKYNPKGNLLKVFIEVMESEKTEHYTIRYYDSLSKEKGTLVNEMQTKIKSSLVDETTGELKPGNWGIQEMKTYAEFLAYKEDYEIHKDNQSGEKFKLWAESYRLDSEQVLSYKFGLLKATLVLVVDPGVKTKPNDNLQKDLGIYFKDFADEESFKAEIHSLSPQFLLFVLQDKDEGKTKQILEFIKKHHLRLPARILIAHRDKYLGRNLDIPKSRVEYIDLIKYPNDSADRQEWEKFFIAVYKEWIIKHTSKDYFTLMIYFDRHSSHPCVKKWERLHYDLEKYDLNNFVNLNLYNQNKKPSSQNIIDGVSLCFDNHSNLSNAVNSPSFYQVVGHDGPTGGNNHTIFDQLQNAPSGFSAMIFILQLIETSLLKVLIIDDRMASHVVEITKEGNIQFKKPIDTGPLIAERLVGANVFFNLSFKFNNEKAACLVKTCEQKDTIEEGVYIEGNKANKILIFKGCKRNSRNTSYLYEPLSSLDTIVIHWGWLEHLKKDTTLHLDINEFLESLAKNFSPRIILTSGRGGSNIPEEYPFIEFSTIESYAMRELSKYHLGNILMSVF